MGRPAEVGALRQLRLETGRPGRICQRANLEQIAGRRAGLAVPGYRPARAAGGWHVISLSRGLKQDATFITRLILAKGRSRLTYGPWSAQACAHEEQAGLSEGEGCWRSWGSISRADA